MNDFTKEELKEMHTSLGGDDSICRIDDDLLNKIQSMIEYCCERGQHDWSAQTGIEYSTCTKCGEEKWP